MKWYQVGSRRDKTCDLFEPLFKNPKPSATLQQQNPLENKLSESFNLNPIILKNDSGNNSSNECKLMGCYIVKDYEKEREKVIEEYSKNQNIFLTFENLKNNVEIIITRNKNKYPESSDNIYNIGSWYKDNKYIWDSTNQIGEANDWLVININKYNLVKIYKGKYHFNNLI